MFRTSPVVAEDEWHLDLEVEGHVAADDKRLNALPAARRPVVLGGYAVPVGGAA